MKRRAQSGWWDKRARDFQDRAAHAFRNIAAAVSRITEAAALRLVARLRALAEKVTPILSDSEWNAFPPFAPGRPAAFSALTASGHMQIPQKRVLAAGNSLSDSEKLRLAAQRIGARA